MAKYALEVNEENLDLISELNDGVRPRIMERTRWFVFETNPNGGVKCRKIKSEDDLYDDKGNRLDTELKFLIG